MYNILYFVNTGKNSFPSLHFQYLENKVGERTLKNTDITLKSDNSGINGHILDIFGPDT